MISKTQERIKALDNSYISRTITAAQGIAQSFSLAMAELPDIGHGGYRKRSKFGDKSKVFHPEQHILCDRTPVHTTQEQQDRHDLKYAVACAKRVKRWLKKHEGFLDVPRPPAHIQEKIIFIRGMKDELDMEALANG